MTGHSLPASDGLFVEDLSQLDFELGRSSYRSDREALERTADGLLSFRLRWLLATTRNPEGAAPWVSELEYDRFREATGSTASHAAPAAQERSIKDRLRPVTGVSRRCAQEFCAWFCAWSRSFGEPANIRLPTVAEARRTPAGPSPSRWLDALSGEVQIGTWCADEARLVCLRPPAALAVTGRLLSALLRLDAWFLFYLGMWNWLRARMPVRETDWDFNENYEQDRCFVERYAARLSMARDMLVALDSDRELGLGLARRLDFEPLQNLRGMSPLDAQRDRIVDAYRILHAECARRAGVDHDFEPGVTMLAEMDVQVLGQADIERLGLAVERLGERGIDPEQMRDRLSSLSAPGAIPGVGARSINAVSSLQSLLAPGPDHEDVKALDRCQWHALEAWAASSEVPEAAAGWRRRLFRRQSEPPKAQPREVLASVYCDLVIMAERRRGRSVPFEGIRLVREN